MKKAFSVVLCVFLLILVSVPVFAATVPKTNEGGVIIDGTLDSSYGDTPVKTVRRSDPSDVSSIFEVSAEDAPDVDYNEVSQDIYMTYDSDYLYFYAVVTGWNWIKHDTAFIITIASLETADSTVRFEWEGNSYDYSARMSFVQFDDGSHFMGYEQCGIGDRDPIVYETDYIFKYLSGNRMAYEARIPRGYIPDVRYPDSLAVSTATRLSTYDSDPASLLWYDGAAIVNLGANMESLNGRTEIITLGTDAKTYVAVETEKEVDFPVEAEKPDVVAPPENTDTPTDDGNNTTPDDTAPESSDDAAATDETKKDGGNEVFLYVILAVIVVAIVAVVLLLVRGGKKKDDTAK